LSISVFRPEEPIEQPEAAAVSVEIEPDKPPANPNDQ
jgi:hypothetical protein